MAEYQDYKVNVVSLFVLYTAQLFGLDDNVFFACFSYGILGPRQDHYSQQWISAGFRMRSTHISSSFSQSTVLVQFKPTCFCWMLVLAVVFRVRDSEM